MHHALLPLLPFLLCLPFLADGRAADDPLITRAVARIEAVHDELITVRRDLHRHPELSGEEERTAGIVAKRLRALSWDVRTGVGGHGVIGVLVGGRPSPVVGFRADMDAVRNASPDPVEFASKVDGVRHICGHDVHTTVGLGIAEGLTEIRAELPGTVKLFFQPAEEMATGARAMLADGALAEPTPAAMFALHTSPMPVGRIGAVEGTFLYGRDTLTTTFTGDGNLTAAVEEYRQILESLTTVGPVHTPQGLAAIDPADDLVLLQIVRSTPESAQQRWTVTVSSAVPRRALGEEIRDVIRLALAELDIPGVHAALTSFERTTSGVENDPALVRASYPALRAVLGEEGLVIAPGVGPAFSEDFGFFLDDLPGAMYWLGVSNPEKGTVGYPHTPNYVADEGAIGVGAKGMTAVLVDFLRKN